MRQLEYDKFGASGRSELCPYQQLAAFTSPFLRISNTKQEIAALSSVS